MVINIPEVQPFEFQASTAFDERVQLANKLNEVIDALNMVGDIPDMQTEIDTLKQSVASLQESIGSTDTNLATVEGNLNKAISDLNALTAKVGTIETTIQGIQSDIAAIEGDISGLDSEVEGLKAEVVDEVSMASTSHGSVQVTIHHEDGTQDTSAPIDLALVQEGGITLQTGATDRSFNLKVTLSDGSSWQTNDFVIPEGGGTDVSVTSIQISQGTSANQIRVRIGLSDGSFINSNDWTVVTPTEFGTLESRVTALEGSPGYNLPVATASVLGGVKIGGNITVQADGTISIPNATTSAPGVMTAAQVAQLNTAAVGSTVMFTGDASKVTLHVDSVAGSAFTEDIPAAADGGAGTIDQASYQKLKTIPDTSTIATKEEITGLKLSKPNDNQIQLNGDSVDIVENVSTQIVEDSTLRVEVNGVPSQVKLPGTGVEWEEIPINTFPTDITADDEFLISIGWKIGTYTYPTAWNEAPSSSLPITDDAESIITIYARPNANVASDTTFVIFERDHPAYVIFMFFLLNSVDRLNDTGIGFAGIRTLIFNGGGRYAASIGISKTDWKYVKKILRKKK